jgi:predicted DNA-binding transcriptional regulator YafY
VNRTDRLYAIVEELRAVSPRPRSASWLARRFEVSIRTVERDLDALRQTGVPIYTENGRTGGYAIDTAHTLPPLGLTPDEALAIMVALQTVAASLLAGSARSARNKIRATLAPGVRDGERLLAQKIAVIEGSASDASTGAVINGALEQGRVLRLSYRGAHGATTRRDVEPLGLLQSRDTEPGWYLVAWCRLRAGVRGFRLDRIGDAEMLPEAAPPRDNDFNGELIRIGAQLLTELDGDDR